MSVSSTQSQFFTKIAKQFFYEKPQTDAAGPVVQLASANTLGIDGNMIDELYVFMESTVPVMQQNGTEKLVKKTFKAKNKRLVRYFDQTYNKYANFSVAHFFTSAQVTGQEFTTTFSKQGDLVFNTYLSFALPGYDVGTNSSFTNDDSAKWAWCSKPGNSLVRSVLFNIGGQKIDENDTNILNFSRDLGLADGRHGMYNKLIGNVPELCEMSTSHVQDQIYVPLNLFFNKGTSCVLPTLQINYNSVELTFTMRTPKDVVCCSRSLQTLDWDSILQIRQFHLVTSPMLDKSVDLRKLLANATARFVLKTAMYKKTYEYKPFQFTQSGVLSNSYYGSSVVPVEASFNKDAFQQKVPLQAQLGFAQLVSQGSSSNGPKSISHFLTAQKNLIQVQEFSAQEGYRILGEDYIIVSQLPAASAFTSNFIDLDHAYGRIKPVQTDSSSFDEESVGICGEPLKIEEISISVDQLIKYTPTKDQSITVSDYIQSFFYEPAQVDKVDTNSAGVITQYLYQSGDIEIYSFLSLSGLDTVTANCTAYYYNVDRQNVSPFSFTKAAVPDPRSITLTKYLDYGYYEGTSTKNPIALNFGKNSQKANYNIGTEDFDVYVKQWDNYGMNIDKSGNPFLQSELRINGTQRFTGLGEKYFNSLVPFECHSNTPPDGINVYSFAIKPEDLRPNGAMNFSRIEQAHFTAQFNDRLTASAEGEFQSKLYALSHNVLVLGSGSAYMKFQS